MFPIGQMGIPWGNAEKAQWRQLQTIQRLYKTEVIDKLTKVSTSLQQEQYGALPYDEQRYPLFALTSTIAGKDKPTVLITGGVHGYETSGVQGALLFASSEIENYIDHFNFIIAPCISPWGYETINRWNPLAVDPNRSFHANSPSPEASAIMSYIQKLNRPILMHIDLHETTDTDNSEFRPALAARDAIDQYSWNIPDGFYLVANTKKPQLPFQKAIIDNVEKITHIAQADDNGLMIGEKVESKGVIYYDKSALSLCGGFTSAPYCSTTEVYPDSPNTTPEECNRAQVAAICGGLDFLRDNA
jgi:hypothetical protein